MLNYSIVNKLITVPIFKIKLCERRVFENMVYGLIDWLIIPCLMINYNNLSRDIKAASSEGGYDLYRDSGIGCF